VAVKWTDPPVWWDHGIYYQDGSFRLLMQYTDGVCIMQAATIFYPADDLGRPVEDSTLGETEGKNKESVPDGREKE
jgi:hypothetical protein